jgi:hypothetical protein
MASLTVEIAKIERNIFALSHEEGYGWNAVETQVDHTIGNAYQIKWSAQDMLKIINGTMTHNHPWPSLPCPSLEDLLFMRGNYLKELRVVSKDPMRWHGIAHRTCTRKGLTWPYFDPAVFVQTLQAVYDKHRIPYYKNDQGNRIHPTEIIIASITASDEAIAALGEKWGFAYKKWTD